MPPVELETLRGEVDAIDEKLIELLARRFQVTAQVGAVKKKLALQPVDPEREATQLIKYRALAVRHGLEPDFVARLFRAIIDEVVVNHGRA